VEAARACAAGGNPVMSHGHAAGQAPDQASEGGRGGAGGTMDMSLKMTHQRAVRHDESHPASPVTNLGRPQHYGRYPSLPRLIGAAILRLVCQFPIGASAPGTGSLPGALYPPSHFEVRQTPLCSIQARRHPPIDVFPVDLPVIDCGGRQLP
jgi:hypothetical protein